MLKPENLKPGDQIIYVPSHARGDIYHRDSDAGFVTSVFVDVAFCRYWDKDNPTILRTLSLSEETPIKCLVKKLTRPQRVVDAALEKTKEA